MNAHRGRRGFFRALLGPDDEGHGAAPGGSGSEEPASRGFSLVVYYAGRAAQPHIEVPRTPLRAGLPVVATTRVGTWAGPDHVDLDECNERPHP